MTHVTFFLLQIIDKFGIYLV